MVSSQERTLPRAGVVGGGAAPDGQERLLDGILHEGGLVEDAQGKHRGPGRVARIEIVKRGAVAGRDAGEQRRIGGGGDVHNVLLIMTELVVCREQGRQEGAPTVWPIWGMRHAPGGA